MVSSTETGCSGGELGAKGGLNQRMRTGMFWMAAGLNCFGWSALRHEKRARIGGSLGRNGGQERSCFFSQRPEKKRQTKQAARTTQSSVMAIHTPLSSRPSQSART